MSQSTPDILNLAVKGYVNLTADELGLDSFQHCFNKKYFTNFPHAVNYHFNELGFRDIPIIKYSENPIIVIGDSFTLGLGLPVQLTYPKQLENLAQHQVLNFSLNGASNDWISRKLENILHHFNPMSIIVHYTFSHRRELNREDWTDDERTLCPLDSIDEQADFENWSMNHEKIKSLTKGIPTIYSAIPNWHHAKVSDLYCPRFLDLARDFFHYGEKTCLSIAKTFAGLLNL